MLLIVQVAPVSSNFPKSAHSLDRASEHFHTHAWLQRSLSVEWKI